MRKHLVACGAVTGAGFMAWAALGQVEPSPTATPQPNITLQPTPVVPSPTPTLPPPSSLLPQPTPPVPQPTAAIPEPSLPPPQATPGAPERGVVEESSTFEYSEKGAPVFTIDKAVITALKQNPDVLRALEEIERTKGVIIEIRAQVLPHITPNATYNWTDPNLRSATSFTTTGAGSTPAPSPIVASAESQVRDSGPQAAAAARARTTPNVQETDVSYSIRVTGTQLIFNGTSWPAIRGTFFQRDSAYFALRNTVDQVIATVKTQFYQVILDRALIVVQEESVRLLESQLKDQQNRFEAGTVPRFNVLQAQVQLYNQIPQLITARNNYRISILQLAKTLGLDFNPARGIAAPLRAVGDLVYVPRNISLLEAIELGKQNRPFLKQARANVLNQIEQVHVALGGFLPTIETTGGGEWVSSPFNSSFHDISKGWVAQVTGSWPIWDSGEVWGRFKQQRALLSETKITYDDDVRQVELEIQQAASNLLQNRELIKSTEKTVEQAEEAVRLAKARLDAGAGTQLDVLNAQTQLTTAQSTRLQALFGYISSLAEFDRATGTQSTYTESFTGIAPHATRSRTYYTGSDVDATGKPKRNVFLPGPVTPMSRGPSGK